MIMMTTQYGGSSWYAVQHVPRGCVLWLSSNQAAYVQRLCSEQFLDDVLCGHMTTTQHDNYPHVPTLYLWTDEQKSALAVLEAKYAEDIWLNIQRTAKRGHTCLHQKFEKKDLVQPVLSTCALATLQAFLNELCRSDACSA